MWSTIEPVDLVQKAYPVLVSNYLDKTKKPTKATKTKKTVKPPTLIHNDDNEGNVHSEKLKKPKKRLQKKDAGKTKEIGEYFKKVKNLPGILSTERKQETESPTIQTWSPKIQTCSTPLSLTQFSFDFNNSNDDVQDLSDIIQGIVSNSPTITNLCGKKLHYEPVNDQLQQKTDLTIDRDENEESVDEFDFMVAGKPLSIRTKSPTTSPEKTTNRPLDKRPSSDDLSHSSTPILITKFFKRNCIARKSLRNKPSTIISPQNISLEPITSTNQNEGNVSFFFGDITEENDAFEKLTDFRNMKDVDEDDVVCLSDRLQEVNDSPPIQLSDTFDLEDYVPVSANLKKRIALAS